MARMGWAASIFVFSLALSEAASSRAAPVLPPPGGGVRPRPYSMTIECASVGNAYRHCASPIPFDYARLVGQRAGARCVEGQSWGSDGSGVWVDRGCRGVFEVTSRWP